VSPDLSGSEYAATTLIEWPEGTVPLERDGRLRPSRISAYEAAAIRWYSG